MFNIVQIHSVGPEAIKPHYISTKAICDEVEQDLTLRYGDVSIIEKDTNNYMWDPGGMCIDNDELYSFPLDHIVLQCKAQHLDRFCEQVNRREPRGNNIEYIKLHGFWTCVCITTDEFGQLKQLIKDLNRVEIKIKLPEDNSIVDVGASEWSPELH